MDFELSDDQREIQALARDFGRAEIEPYAADWDRAHGFPRELVAKLADLGFMGVCSARGSCHRSRAVRPSARSR